MQGFEGFYSFPFPNFVVVTMMNNRTQKGSFKSSPNNLLGRKIYTSLSLQLQLANQQAFLSKYNFLNWIVMSRFIQFLSISPPHPPSQSLFKDPCHETLLIQQINSLLALGAVDEVLPEHWGHSFYFQYFLINNLLSG